MSKKDKEIMIKADDTATPTVKVKTKKRGGCGTFFLGFVFAFVLMLVLVVGTGLYMYYNMSIKTVENMIGVTIPLEGDIKNLALKDLLVKKDKLVNASLETLNTEFKLDLPETIPGTKISLKETYDEEITFLDTTKKVKEFRVQDIVNNLGDFVDAVLPALYKHVTIGQITETAQTTILNDLGYPATKDAGEGETKFYNVGTETEPVLKNLSELTIEQALDVVPAYFGSDNLTVQMALDAIGSDLLPEPEEGKADIYAELRAMKITDITTDTIKTKVTGEILLDLVDLTGYDFLQTDEFKQTTLNGLGDYLTGLTLGEFVELKTVVAGDSEAYKAYFKATQYANLAQDLKLSKVKSTILGLKLKQIFSETEITAITSIYGEDSAEMTVVEFLSQDAITSKTSGTEIDFETATTAPETSTSAIAWANYEGSYVDIIRTATASTYEDSINTANVQDLLGGNDLITPIARLADLTIGEIKDSDNAVNTLLEQFTTLSDMFGDGNTDGIFGIIGEVEITALFNDPATAINDALESSTKTLADLLNVTNVTSENAIIQSVMGIQIKTLFTDKTSAITDAIKTKTLGDLMGTTTGFVKYLSGVTIGDIMGLTEGVTASDAIKNALTKQTVDGVKKDITLGEFLEIDSTSASGVLAKMTSITMGDLLNGGDSATTAINGVVDSLTLKDVFGDLGADASAILKELYAMTTESGAMKVNEVFDNITKVKLSTVLGTTTASGIYTLIVVEYTDDNGDTKQKEFAEITIDDMKNIKAKSDIKISDLYTAGLTGLTAEEYAALDNDVKNMKITEAVKKFDELYKASKASSSSTSGGSGEASGSDG